MLKQLSGRPFPPGLLEATDGWMDGWMDGWWAGWVDGWIRSSLEGMGASGFTRADGSSRGREGEGKRELGRERNGGRV